MFHLLKQHENRAFTLLEVILALALSVLVLAAIGFAISAHLRFFNAGRTGVEEAQLARAILSRIADDLRNAVPYQSSSSSAATSTTTAASSSSASEDEAASNPFEGNEEPGETEAGATEPTQETTVASDDLSTAAPENTPGLYGNAEQLELDVSRLPRRDQLYWSLQGDEEINSWDRPLGDVKNVVYFVRHGEMDLTPPTLSVDPALEQRPGLYRREMDRAAALYAAQRGGQATLDQAAELMAPEVEALEFRYFDGQEWLDYWDSSVLEGLPLAVEIRLKLIRRPVTSRQAPTSVIYRQVVHLPTAQPATDSGGLP
ncbi:MAG: prepilin-type N-terminal cleavage/methylation domain-containing protein [Pirellulales bacterium]|nr:prepilin-type N-terminal cleavage/methylation domain-containing protein [Pirellulales bacterium]